MREFTNGLMRTTFDKCTEDQYDDIESQFENMEVIWLRAMEKYGTLGELHKNHMPALELHLGECVHDFNTAIEQSMRNAAMQGERHININALAFDFFKTVFLFGYEVGKMNWPLQVTTCEEVHGDD